MQRARVSDWERKGGKGERERDEERQVWRNLTRNEVYPYSKKKKKFVKDIVKCTRHNKISLIHANFYIAMISKTFEIFCK